MNQKDSPYMKAKMPFGSVPVEFSKVATTIFDLREITTMSANFTLSILSAITDIPNIAPQVIAEPPFCVSHKGSIENFLNTQLYQKKAEESLTNKAALFNKLNINETQLLKSLKIESS
jgi:hypothetical protein